jgi:hypothetical protein
MTLKGANKALKRGSTNEIVRDTELLERLQRIRAALVEVREELKAGDGEQLVPEVAAESAVQPEPQERTQVVERFDEPSQPAEEQPRKRVVRRKKRADEEDKELFPFYEQSLF